MGEKTELTIIDTKDPLFQKKKEIIDGMNYMSGLLHREDEEKKNILLWVVSIILGALIGSFLQAGNYIWALILFNILLILLIHFFVKKNDEYRELWKSYKIVEKQAKENDIKLPKNPNKKNFFKLILEQLFN